VSCIRAVQVPVDQADAHIECGKCQRDVDRRRCFTDTTFAAGYGDDGDLVCIPANRRSAIRACRRLSTAQSRWSIVAFVGGKSLSLLLEGPVYSSNERGDPARRQN
jgi:hypothetical protein